MYLSRNLKFSKVYKNSQNTWKIYLKNKWSGTHLTDAFFIHYLRVIGSVGTWKVCLPSYCKCVLTNFSLPHMLSFFLSSPYQCLVNHCLPPPFSFVSVLPNFKIGYKFVRIGKAEGIYQNHHSSGQQKLIFAYIMFYWHHGSSGLKLGRLVCRKPFREQGWCQLCYPQLVINIKVCLGISILEPGRKILKEHTGRIYDCV